MGSPPYTREKEAWGCSKIRRQGITPAYAGKSQLLLANHPPLQDHPRIRGKKFFTTICSTNDLGSPPHTREKGSPSNDHTLFYRITPAYAGKSAKNGDKAYAYSDHPRIRGKKLFLYIRAYTCKGSPPHTREKVFNSFFNMFWIRITPAYAGKSQNHQRTSDGS